MSEMQLRHMWKVMIGNSPGLEAEIAKLHATHAAKLCYLEYEREFGRERQVHTAGPPLVPIPWPPPNDWLRTTRWQDRKSRASAVEIARRSVVERRVEVSDPEESHTASGESSSEGDGAARSAPSSTAPRGPPAKATSTAATASAEPRGAREGASAAPSDAAAGDATTDGGGDGIDLRSQNSFGVAVGWLLGQLRGAQPSTHRAHASKAGAEAADSESTLCSAPGRIWANASAAPPRLDGEIVRV